MNSDALRIKSLMKNNKNIAYFIPLYIKDNEFFYLNSKKSRSFRYGSDDFKFELFDEIVSVLDEDVSRTYILKCIKSNTNNFGIIQSIKEMTQSFYDRLTYDGLSGSSINDLSQDIDDYTFNNNGIALINLNKNRCILFTLILQGGAHYPIYRTSINSFIISDTNKLIPLTNDNMELDIDGYLIMLEGLR
jgi:hypothetical protein